MDIPLIFAFLAIFGVIVYGLADGFDLELAFSFSLRPARLIAT
jgi:hypothetical protein